VSFNGLKPSTPPLSPISPFAVESLPSPVDPTTRFPIAASRRELGGYSVIDCC
jgi:hypothetical protein